MKVIRFLLVLTLLLKALPVFPDEIVDYGIFFQLEGNDSLLNESGIYDWSRDGKYLAVSNDNSLWLFPVDGSEPVKVNNDNDSYYYPRFSPDSSEIIALRIHSTGSAIEGISLETGEHRIVFNNIKLHHKPVSSNTGKYLAYFGKYGSHECPILYDLENKKVTLYKEVMQEKTGVIGTFDIISFNPDDTELMISKDILSNDINNSRKFFRVSVESGEATEIDLGQGVHWTPRYSPDGRWLLFTREIRDNRNYSMSLSCDLCVCHIETGEYFNFISDSEYYTSWGLWSPDGESILYTRYSHKDDGPLTERNGDLYIVDFDPAHYLKQTSIHATSQQRIKILGSFPNPFNHATSIEFSLPEAGFASFAIYNIMGQKVRTLESGYLNTGFHNTVWDGRDDFDNVVSSGVYICRLKTGEQVAAKQMMLMK